MASPTLLWLYVIILQVSAKFVTGKYVEGHLKTLEDWAFIARFCFLSGRGRYEYQIEFERRYGEPQLLLYYDDESQWPAIYKTSKSCVQKLSVLSIPDNQIVTLSARSPYNDLSGCALRSSRDENEPEFPKPNPHPQPSPEPNDSKDDEWNYTYFGQFLKTSTTFAPVEEASVYDFNATSFNESESFNLSSVSSSVPFGIDMGFENEAENNTRFMEYAEELFPGVGNASKGGRVKRAFWRSDHRGTLYVTCRSSGGFITSRERWWYIAIANCGSKKGIDVKYKFRMTNGPTGDFWHEHFSADEMYIPPLLLAESICYTFLMLAIFICAIELKTRHLFHCTYRLFTISASLQFMGVLFAGVAWTKYAVTGLGPHSIVGTLLQGASEISFLALLLLMAKGYTITRARLSTCSTVKLMIFINVYVVVYIALFIYREEVFDPGEVLNLYESPAGLGIAGLRCGAWGAFLVSTLTTARKFPEKSTFYYPFGILGSMWILGGPILVFIGISFFDAWVRESVMCGAFAMLSICGHASFLWLTWPSRANISFPYHVRTNHVGVMSTEDDGADYPRHIYEPTMPDQNIILPLSQRTEELLNGVYSQYLCERDYYNSATTPHSHVSFPIDNTTRQGVNPHGDQTSLSVAAAARSTIPPSMEASAPPENQTDSGHSSFDVQSTTNKTATPPKDENRQRFELKNNPFVINGVKSPPNKIILEPISPPIQSSPGDVPRHLFAARKSVD